MRSLGSFCIHSLLLHLPSLHRRQLLSHTLSSSSLASYMASFSSWILANLSTRASIVSSNLHILIKATVCVAFVGVIWYKYLKISSTTLLGLRKFKVENPFASFWVGALKQGKNLLQWSSHKNKRNHFYVIRYTTLNWFNEMLQNKATPNIFYQNIRYWYIYDDINSVYRNN